MTAWPGCCLHPVAHWAVTDILRLRDADQDCVGEDHGDLTLSKVNLVLSVPA